MAIFLGLKYRLTPKLLIAGRYELFNSTRNENNDSTWRIAVTSQCKFKSNFF